MKRNNKMGFTTVELVIVIAVIAILAAVLIPTFTSLIKKAEDSAYQQEKHNQMLLDLQEEVLKGNENYITWEELEELLATKLGEIQVGVSQAEVEAAINAALAGLNTGNNGLSKSQVEKIIKNALKNFDTLSKEEVEAIINNALANWEANQPTVPEQPTESEIPAGAAQVTDFVGLKIALDDPSVSYIVLNGAFAVDETLAINRDLTINMDGKSMNFVAADSCMFEIAAGAELELKNGSLYARLSDGYVAIVAEAGTADNRTQVTLDKVSAYIHGENGGDQIYVFDIYSYTDVNLKDTYIKAPGESAQEGNITYSGDATVFYVNSGTANTTINVDGGKIEMKGTGSMNIVQTGSTSGVADDYDSKVVININDAEIIMDDVSEEKAGYVIAFNLTNTISEVNVTGGSISISGADDWDIDSFGRPVGENYYDAGAFLTKRNGIYAGSNRGFHGTIVITDTDIEISNVHNLELTEDNDNYTFGGTCTINGGVHTGYDFAGWGAEGYTYAG